MRGKYQFDFAAATSGPTPENPAGTLDLTVLAQIVAARLDICPAMSPYRGNRTRDELRAKVCEFLPQYGIPVAAADVWFAEQEAAAKARFDAW